MSVATWCWSDGRSVVTRFRLWLVALSLLLMPACAGAADDG